MPNSVLLSVDSITADRLSGVLLDSTSYTNPLRNTVAVFITGRKLDVNGVVTDTLTVVGNNGNVLTDSSWTFNIPLDGWYSFLYVAIPFYNGGTSYDLYDAVYTGGLVYRSLQNSNVGNSVSDTNYWELITDPGSLALNKEEANESLNIDSQNYQGLLSPNAEYNYSNAIADASDMCCGDDCTLEALYVFIKMEALIEGTYTCSDRGEYSKGEEILRRFESIVESLS